MVKANSALARLLLPYRPGPHPSVAVAHKVSEQHFGGMTTTRYQLTGLPFVRPGSGAADVASTCLACHEPVRVAIASVGSARRRVWTLRLATLLGAAAFITCGVLSIADQTWVFGTLGALVLTAFPVTALEQEDGVRLRDRTAHELKFPEPGRA